MSSAAGPAVWRTLARCRFWLRPAQPALRLLDDGTITGVSSSFKCMAFFFPVKAGLLNDIEAAVGCEILLILALVMAPVVQWLCRIAAFVLGATYVRLL
jgi:hypothetical protein